MVDFFLWMPCLQLCRLRLNMGDPGQGQPPIISAVQVPFLAMPYQANQTMGSTAPISSGHLTTASQVQLTQHQLSYQHIHKQQLQQLDQMLRMFWASQYQEIMASTDFKNHGLPLARIKKIMTRACEMFILELTYCSWAHAEENKRRTLQKNDIAGAITRTDVFDFLVDIVPGEHLKEEVNANDSLSYYYVPPHVGTLRMIKPEVDQGLLYAQQPQSYMPQKYWLKQQTTQRQQHQEQQPSEDS